MSLSTMVAIKAESTYGTAVTPDRPFEYTKESIKPQMAVVESKGMRNANRVLRQDRFQPNILGYAGGLTLDVLSKDFGLWLKYLLGTVATTGAGPYVHTGTIGNLAAAGSFTAQIWRPLDPVAMTNQAFTYEGGMVNKWSISCNAQGIAECDMDLVFEDASTATAAITPSWTASMEPLSWAYGYVTVNGTSVPVTKWKVSVDNALKIDRYKQRNTAPSAPTSARRQQPYEDDYRKIEVELECDWTDLTTFYNRAIAETVSGAIATNVVLGVRSPTLISGATYPGVAITIPAVRIDSAEHNEGGTSFDLQSIKGTGVNDGTNEPISVAYTTSTATP